MTILALTIDLILVVLLLLFIKSKIHFPTKKEKSFKDKPYDIYDS